MDPLETRVNIATSTLSQTREIVEYLRFSTFSPSSPDIMSREGDLVIRMLTHALTAVSQGVFPYRIFNNQLTHRCLVNVFSRGPPALLCCNFRLDWDQQANPLKHQNRRQQICCVEKPTSSTKYYKNQPLFSNTLKNSMTYYHNVIHSFNIITRICLKPSFHLEVYNMYLRTVSFTLTFP